MSAPLINFDILLGVVLPILIVGAVLLTLVLIFLVPMLTRGRIKRTGELANATILEIRHGRGTLYSGSEYNHNVVAQKVILKLEVRPSYGTPYPAEDSFMAKAEDLMKLQPGCNAQVRVDPRNPKRVVLLPETITASANAPIQARAGLAIADLLAKGSNLGPEEVLKAFQAQGIRSQPMPVVDDPKAKLAKLREMLDAGLITQQDFEAKKAEILSRM